MFEKRVAATLRPLYKRFFERPLWWFLSRVKAYFFTEVGRQLEDIGKQLQALEHRQAVIEDRLQTMEANNMAQWEALEQFVLAMFRQSDTSAGNGETRLNENQDFSVSAKAEAHHTHAASSLR